MPQSYAGGTMAWNPYVGDAYWDYPKTLKWCEALAEAHPDWFALEQIGQSGQGRPIVLLTVGNQQGELAQKSALWVDAGTHASEWTGVMATLFSLSQWAEALSKGDPQLVRWFSDHTVFVLPCMSPDGFQALCEGAPFMRSTLRPPPKGTVRAGMDPCDVNGDGEIRSMRWRHPAGPFVSDEERPGGMRHRQLTDDPENAYFLCPEGEFLQWDGVSWTSAPREFGLDLNRNFPGSWSPFRMFGMDGGAYPLSEPESRAAMDAVHARKGVALAVTHHTYTGALLSQPYRKDGPLGDADIDLMYLLGENLVRRTHYELVKVSPDFTYDEKKPIVGVWADTLTTTRGIPAYTLELWNPFAFAGAPFVPKDMGKFFRKPDPKVITALWDGFAKLPGAIAPWKSFDHPQLGAVEIGGLDTRLTLRNPPVSHLAKECENAHALVDDARKALPELHVASALEPIEAEGGGTRLQVVFENRGFLPTSGLKIAESKEMVPGISVSLDLGPGVRLLHGTTQRDVGHLDGWGSDIAGSARHPLYSGLGDRGHRAVESFLLTGRGEVTIAWTGGRAGSGSFRIPVK